MDTPTGFHPALTDSRLAVIASLIREARHSAVLDRKPSLGDNAWVLGCTAYGRSCHAILRATRDYPEWLSIVEGGKIDDEGREAEWALHFVFAIGGVPLRFYRGEPDDIPSRSLAKNLPEIHMQQLAFAYDPEPEKLDLALRLAVETDALGEVTTVTLVKVLEANGQPVGKGWTIDDSQQPRKVASFNRKEEGRDLGKPRVGSRKQRADEGETN